MELEKRQMVLVSESENEEIGVARRTTGMEKSGQKSFLCFISNSQPCVSSKSLRK